MRATRVVLSALIVSVLSSTSVSASTRHLGVDQQRPQHHTCAHNIASTIVLSPKVDQLMTVSVPFSKSTKGELTLWQREGTCWSFFSGPFPAHVGANGVSAHRTEGDLTTPLGTYGLEGTFYGINANPGVHYRYHRLVCGDWWDEDPSSPMYNRFVHVPCGQSPPFGGDSEALWRTGLAYDYLAVITFNTDPVIAGRGSGIFLHVDTGSPTAGCVSIPNGSLLQSLRWLRPSEHPRIAIVLAQPS